MQHPPSSIHPLIILIIHEEHAVALELRARGEFGTKWPGRAWNTKDPR